MRSLTLVGTSVDMWRPLPDDDVRPVIEQCLALLDGNGPEASLAARPPRAAATFEALFMAEEAEEHGGADTFALRHDASIRVAAEAPLAERVAYHVAELRNLEAYFTGDARDYARAARAPTLVLHGERDRAIPIEWARALAALVPGAELRVFVDHSHGLSQRSDEARRAAVEFITSHDHG